MKPLIVLVDDSCVVCNRLVRFIVVHDKSGTFKFAGLKSDAATSLLQKQGLDPDSLNSVVLISDGQVRLKSDAIIEILLHLPTYTWFGKSLKLVPRFLREAGYSLVAIARGKIAGRTTSCAFHPDFTGRFISS